MNDSTSDAFKQSGSGEQCAPEKKKQKVPCFTKYESERTGFSQRFVQTNLRRVHNVLEKVLDAQYADQLGSRQIDHLASLTHQEQVAIYKVCIGRSHLFTKFMVDQILCRGLVAVVKELRKLNRDALDYLDVLVKASEEAKALKKRIEWLTANAEKGLSVKDEILKDEIDTLNSAVFAWCFDKN